MLTLLRHYKRITSPRCMMKIDLRKAYDMVSWEFIEEALHGYGFPETFTRLVMSCVTSTKLSIKALQKVGELPNFKFHRMCHSTKLKHLILVDDLMLFCKGDLKSTGRMIEVLNHFSRVTGLMANLDKSNIFVAGVDDAMKEQMLQLTGFTLGDLPIRYLGLPLSSKKWTRIDLHQLVDKITNRITRVDKKCRDYLWGNKENKRNVALVSWEKICVPKKNGGLNIKSCKLWNIASVGKLIWQIDSKADTLWIRWVHGPYMKDEQDVWTHTPSKDSSWYSKLNSIKLTMRMWYTKPTVYRPMEHIL
ncbi:hypothetical protein MTR67_051137 [Solanum verrucosum]|uniref:Reverse transcriptase domain-containing protein n=1 Tax=Solanum verrucosum TaxID=315347 RepID=A0AAF0ZYV3_SOLVR|nr:hypothetical protein MTR67_051137 [Solanum verrucosum]